jgi:tetratricopeptide (TPR) repeat protein
MAPRSFVSAVVCVAAALCVSLGSSALPAKGDPVPPFQAVDIQGRVIDLEAVMNSDPDLIITFLFSPQSGEGIAKRLNLLHAQYGREKIRIIAFGADGDEAALRDFAARNAIEYAIIPPDASGTVEKLFGPVEVLPLTMIVAPKQQVWQVLAGGGGVTESILTKTAEAFLVQGKTEEAKAIADVAAKEGEDAGPARQVKAFALTAEGKLDEAEQEFGAINATAGLARVALERGELDKAKTLADQAGTDGYAQSIKGRALLQEGKLEEANAAFEAAKQQAVAFDWQQSEAFNGSGRVKQEQGDTDGAVSEYEQAVELEPYNVVALSNEGAAHRAAGNLEKSAEALTTASERKDDKLVTLMLRQVQEELKRTNDTQRAELIRSQIADLRQRFEELKATGQAERQDAWSTRPMVMAFLPTDSAVYFERAGTETVLRQAIQEKLAEDPRVRIVEREVLDTLLQELQLGSSELADANTQLQLGQVLSAQLLGFVDFARLGSDVLMNVRMVDTETTEITVRSSKNIRNETDITGVVEEVANELLQKTVASRKLQGLIADAQPDTVMINVGSAVGVAPGQAFLVFKEGEPIEVAGRTIAHKQITLGRIEVTEVNEEYATARIVETTLDTPFEKGTKIIAVGE